MAQIVEVFLSRLNVPADEVEAFTELIKERNMGELFKHFQGYDVQATRKEEHDKTVEEDIKKLINIAKKHNWSQESVKEDLMEQYDLQEKEAEEKIELYWKE